MKKSLSHQLTAILFTLTALLAGSQQPARGQRVGLVLSGGGARGIAHIGLIQALEDHDIPIDYITGTSMGAIVGALYAMGYSTDEMMQLLKSDEFHLWQTGKIDDSLVDYYRAQEPTPSLLSVHTTFADSVKVRKFLPLSLINPQPMNFAFLKLFSNATARTEGQFDHLFVPFRAIASDIYNKRPLVFGSGNLGDAVRASMTFPFVFKPIEVGGMLVFDGGIYNNFPVDIMKSEFAPDFIIGSSVSENPAKPTEDDLMGQIENMVMQKTNYSVDSIDGITIQIKLPDVSLLDFQKADELYRVGYEKGLEHLEAIRARVDRRVGSEAVRLNRLVYRSHDPEVSFDSVKISGVTPAQRRYLAKRFQHRHEERISMSEAERAYFGLVSDSKISEIMPSVEAKPDGGYNLRLRVRLNQDLETSIGGLVTSLNSNRVFLGVGYRFISSLSGDVAASGQVGKTYNTALVSTQFHLPTDYPLHIELKYAFINQRYYENENLFSSQDSPCFIRQNESYGLFGLGMPLGLMGKMTYGIGVAAINDRYYQNKNIDFTKFSPDHSRYRLMKAYADFDINRITARDYPLEGFRHQLRLAFFTGPDTYIPATQEGESYAPGYSRTHISWLQGRYQYETYLKLTKKTVLGLSGELLLSNKKPGQNYTATILQAPVFQPTPHSQVVFNEAYRAFNYLALGLKPIWKINDLLHLRSEVYLFQPGRSIEPTADNRARLEPMKISPHYIGELSAVLKFSFVSISGFVGYYSAPKGNWNCGINIGCLMNTRRFGE